MNLNDRIRHLNIDRNGIVRFELLTEEDGAYLIELGGEDKDGDRHMVVWRGAHDVKQSCLPVDRTGMDKGLSDACNEVLTAIGKSRWPWSKLPAYDGHVHQGCLSCPTPSTIASLQMTIAVGFGCACVVRDEETIYDESSVVDDAGYWTVAEAEKAALADPDHDWRIVKNGPMHGETYQRHGVDQWVMIDSNQGFA